jgi:hypothetical protein
MSQPKWSHMAITFSSQDVNLTSFPHTDLMVITVQIYRWDSTKILINNGSQGEILFLLAFDKMRFDQKQLSEPSKPLYGFSGRRTEPAGAITLLVSYGTPKNTRTEYITFDVVDMPYPYSAIFGRGLLNTFEPALHSAYLCLKLAATFGVISLFGSQKHREGLHVRPQKYTHSARTARRARAAQGRTFGRTQKNHKGRR